MPLRYQYNNTEWSKVHVLILQNAVGEKPGYYIKEITRNTFLARKEAFQSIEKSPFLISYGH